MEDISIIPYNKSYEHDLLEAFTLLQDFEKSLNPIRRPGTDIATQYIEELHESIRKGSGALFIATVDDKFVGFIAGWIKENNELINIPESHTYGYISDAYVIPEYRSKGVFKKLEQRMLDHFSQNSAVTFVRIQALVNNNAIKTYEHMGYTQEEITLIKRIKSQ